MIYTIVSDIEDVDKNNIIVDLDLFDKFSDTYLLTYSIPINLEKIGLTSDMDYEFQLSKDLERITRRLRQEKNKIPTIEEIQEELNKINYLIIDVRGLR